MSIVKLIGFAIGTSLVANVVKMHYPQYAVYIKTIAGVIIVTCLAVQVGPLVNTVNFLATKANMSDVNLQIMFKVIGIAYASEIGCQICKDAGEEGMAKYIEMGAKISILLIAHQIILALVDLIIQLIN